MNNKSGSERGNEQLGENWEYFLDLSYFDMWCVRNKAFTAFGQSLHLNNKDEAIGLFDLLEAKDNQLSHLQKLVEDQKGEIEIQDEQRQKLLDLHMKEEAALQSQLAEQTERVRRLEEAIENYFKNYRCGEVCIEVEVADRLQKALQDSLGDGGKGCQ